MPIIIGWSLLKIFLSNSSCKNTSLKSKHICYEPLWVFYCYLNANYPLITYNYRSETSENIFIEFSLQKYINLYKINLLGLEVFELKNNLFFRRLQNQAGVSKSVFWTIHGGFWKVQTGWDHYSATYDPCNHFFHAPLIFEKNLILPPPPYL